MSSGNCKHERYRRPKVTLILEGYARKGLDRVTGIPETGLSEGCRASVNDSLVIKSFSLQIRRETLKWTE